MAEETKETEPLLKKALPPSIISVPTSTDRVLARMPEWLRASLEEEARYLIEDGVTSFGCDEMGRRLLRGYSQARVKEVIAFIATMSFHELKQMPEDVHNQIAALGLPPNPDVEARRGNLATMRHWLVIQAAHKFFL